MIEQFIVPLMATDATRGTAYCRCGLADGLQLIPMAGGTRQCAMDTFDGNLVTECAVFTGNTAGRVNGQ